MRETREDFQKKLSVILADIGEDILSYDESEYWMIQSAYEYIEYFSIKHQLLNTAIALPLARGLHDGDHRKLTVMRGESTYRLPYLIHPLLVCRMLIDLYIPMSKEEKDILLAAALCHDMIEDIPFMDHGKELELQYHLNRKVYDTVLTVSKRKDFTEEEEQAHFKAIQENPLALLIKLSDRGNNVEDLYNMSSQKVHRYIDETKKLIMPMCDYAKKHYEDILPAIIILEEKILCLIEAAEILVDRYDMEEKKLIQQLEDLRKENEELRNTWKQLWKNL